MSRVRGEDVDVNLKKSTDRATNVHCSRIISVIRKSREKHLPLGY